MIEKVNMKHPDKIADRIAGAIVDLAYSKQDNPKVAVEILIGHDNCFIINETSIYNTKKEIEDIVFRIVGYPINIEYIEKPQDGVLSLNQAISIRCGDNGIFLGKPLTDEEKELSAIARDIYTQYSSDGKYILDKKKLIICQSQVYQEKLLKRYYETLGFNVTINPLGYWQGGIDTDTGAVNRKLGSDMGHSVTGGGLHGKDLSKGDVSINIYAFLKAQETGEQVEISCGIGDQYVDGIPYEEIVEIARKYINAIGGFEKLAEWGLF